MLISTNVNVSIPTFLLTIVHNLILIKFIVYDS